MIDKLKENWKTVLVGAAVAGLICWGVWGCESKSDEPAIIEGVPIEAVPEATPEEVVE